MAQNTTITGAISTWVQLTDADVTAITFQNNGSHPVMVKGTTDTTTPTDFTGAVAYHPSEGERAVAMSDLFPGIAAVRLWAFCSSATINMAVSHA